MVKKKNKKHQKSEIPSERKYGEDISERRKTKISK